MKNWDIVKITMVGRDDVRNGDWKHIFSIAHGNQGKTEDEYVRN